MILEKMGEGDIFHTFFLSLGGRPLKAGTDDDNNISVPGTVKYLERSPAQHIRLAGITFNDIDDNVWDPFFKMVCHSRDEKLKGRSIRRYRRSG